MWVLRLGSVACRDGKDGEIGVVEIGVGSWGGKACRCALYVWASFPGSGGYSLGINLAVIVRLWVL
jgi:hypothetical protein